MIGREAYDRIVDLEYAYAACLDDDRLEAWPDLFVEDCVYNITTRENVEDGLPLGIFYCHNRAQLRDRVKILRNAAVFSLRYYRHLVSNIRILAHEDAFYDVEAHYAVYATDVVDGHHRNLQHRQVCEQSDRERRRVSIQREGRDRRHRVDS